MDEGYMYDGFLVDVQDMDDEDGDEDEDDGDGDGDGDGYGGGTDTADYQRVYASKQYVQMTHSHMRFNEEGAGDEMLLDPNYDGDPTTCIMNI